MSQLKHTLKAQTYDVGGMTVRSGINVERLISEGEKFNQAAHKISEIVDFVHKYVTTLEIASKK